VHLGLVVTVAVSLVFEPVLMLHVVLGYAFLGFVGAHLLQRRRVSTTLARRLAHPSKWFAATGRLALADALLTCLTAAMLGSGLWDWLAPHPTRIRWHAIVGVALIFLLLLHTVRRRRRLRQSRIR
jgi:hypothetical protein